MTGTMASPMMPYRAYVSRHGSMMIGAGTPGQRNAAPKVATGMPRGSQATATWSGDSGDDRPPP